MKHIFFDIETTGLEHSEGHRIASIGAIAYSDDSLQHEAGRYYQKINPQREFDPESSRINGLTLAALQGEPVFAQIADEMLSFIKESVLYAHYGDGFDFPFVDSELKRAGKPVLRQVIASSIDTYKTAKKFFPYERKNGLDALIKRARLPARGTHDALEDVKILAEVYRRLFMS